MVDSSVETSHEWSLNHDSLSNDYVACLNDMIYLLYRNWLHNRTGSQLKSYGIQ